MLNATGDGGARVGGVLRRKKKPVHGILNAPIRAPGEDILASAEGLTRCYGMSS